MNIVIINGSARKGNTLTTIDAFIKGASEKNEIEIIKPENHYGIAAGTALFLYYPSKAFWEDDYGKYDRGFF